jgi:fucose permease
VAEPFLAEAVKAIQGGLQTQQIQSNSITVDPIGTVMPDARVVYQHSDDSLKVIHNCSDFMLKNTTVNDCSMRQNNGSNEAIWVNPLTTDIWRAFLIVASVIVLVLAGFVFILVKWERSLKEIKRKEEEMEQDDGTEIIKETKKFKAVIISMVFIFYLLYCILEMNYANFLLTYAVKHLQWSKSNGASVTAVFWTTFTIGRGLGIFLVKIMKPQTLLLVDLVLTAASLSPIVFFANAHVSVLWISSAVFGLGMATIFATGITWTERYIKVTGSVGSVFMIAGAGGEMAVPVFVSVFFRLYGPGSFSYILFIVAVSLLLLFICMQLVASHRGERYVKVNKDLETNTEETEPIPKQSVSITDNQGIDVTYI